MHEGIVFEVNKYHNFLLLDLNLESSDPTYSIAYEIK